MLKVFMAPPGESWVSDATINEYTTTTRHQIVTNPSQADVIWLYAKWIADRIPNTILQSKPCITTVHHIVPEKGLDINFFDRFTDFYHVPNKFTFQALSERTTKPIRQLPYWVPIEFKSITNAEVDSHISPEIISPMSYVFGSFQRDTEGVSIKSAVPQPKLEKGPDILVSVLERFWNERYALILAGWRRQYIKSRIPQQRLIDYTANEDLDCKAVPTTSDVNMLYNVLRRHNGIYLITSRHEGGPQAVLEAAATSTRVLSTTMGIAPDILHPDCLCGQADDDACIDTFERKIRDGLDWDSIIAHNTRRVTELSVPRIVAQYDDLVEELYATKR
jgi:glycosyltransferase involved in cell wall biosynthesis